MTDKNALLARIFNDRQLALAASIVENHRITDHIDPWTGEALLNEVGAL